MTATLPSRTFRAGNWRLLGGRARFRSPISGATQTIMRPGAIWLATMQLPAMNAEQAREWAGALADAATGDVRALVAPPILPCVQGIGAPVVSGANQEGQTLNTSGWTAGAVVPGGSFFSLTIDGVRHLHIVPYAFTVPSGGNVALQIRPGLRKSPANGAALNFTAPRCEMQLDADEVAVLQLDEPGFYGGSIEWREVAL